MSRDSATIAPYIAAALAVMVWGATPAATRFAVAEIDPGTVGILRTVLAGALVLPWALATRQRLPGDTIGRWQLLISSIAGFIGFTVLFSIGVAQTSTAHAGLIVAAAPVLTGLIGFATSRNWPRPLWWVGAAIALIGEAVLMFGRFGDTVGNPATIEGDLMLLAGTACASAGYVAGGGLATRIGTLPATAWSIGIAAVLLLPALWWLSPRTDWAAVGALGWGGVVSLALGASVIGYAAWYWAIGQAGIARVAPLQFAQPLVALIIAVAVLSEPITTPIVVSTLLVLAGVVVTRRA